VLTRLARKGNRGVLPLMSPRPHYIQRSLTSWRFSKVKRSKLLTSVVKLLALRNLMNSRNHKLDFYLEGKAKLQSFKIVFLHRSFSHNPGRFYFIVISLISLMLYKMVASLSCVLFLSFCVLQNDSVLGRTLPSNSNVYRSRHVRLNRARLPRHREFLKNKI
jgi:hypothetical protein